MQRDTSARIKRDLIGGPVFWGAAFATVLGLVGCLALTAMRAWIGVALLLMWTLFSMANAVRSRRLHSLLSAPVYLSAAVALVGTAMGRIDVQIWMIWVLGAGMIAANLSERIFGRYV